MLMMMTGIGALAGTMVIASLGDFRHKGWLLLGASASFGAFLILFAQSGTYSLALFAMLGVGVANVAYMTSNITLIQMHVDDRLRGRVMSIYMVNVSLMPIASLGTAAVAESLGAPFAVTVGGVIIIVFILAMVIFRSSLRNL